MYEPKKQSNKLEKNIAFFTERTIFSNKFL